MRPEHGAPLAEILNRNSAMRKTGASVWIVRTRRSAAARAAARRRRPGRRPGDGCRRRARRRRRRRRQDLRGKDHRRHHGGHRRHQHGQPAASTIASARRWWCRPSSTCRRRRRPRPQVKAPNWPKDPDERAARLRSPHARKTSKDPIEAAPPPDAERTQRGKVSGRQRGGNSDRRSPAAIRATMPILSPSQLGFDGGSAACSAATRPRPRRSRASRRGNR